MNTATVAQKIVTYEKEFNGLFGVELRLYMSPIFGFDIFAFEDFLGVPENISMEAFLIGKYNQRAAEVVYQLL